MLQRNYNTTTGDTYTRLSGLSITATAKSNEYVCVVNEREAVVKADGKFVYIDSPTTSFTVMIDTNDTAQISLINPPTGEAIPNSYTTTQHAFLAFFAVLRKHQKDRDAQEL